MKLTSATRYALRALVYLARHGGEGPVPSHVIARAEGLLEGFLLKALKPPGGRPGPALPPPPPRRLPPGPAAEGYHPTGRGRGGARAGAGRGPAGGQRPGGQATRRPAAGPLRRGGRGGAAPA